MATTNKKEKLTLSECDDRAARLKLNKKNMIKSLKLTKEELNKLLEMTAGILWFNEPIKVYFKLEIASKLVEKGFISIESDGKYSKNDRTMEIWDIYQKID